MTVIGLEQAGQAVQAAPTGVIEQVWVRRLGWFAASCAVAAALLGLLGLVDIVKGVTAWPASLLLVALAGLATTASVAAHRTQAALLGRLNLFGQALEASPDAQLILAADQSVAYANAALRDLFPMLSAAPLESIAARLDGGARSQEEFERLLAHAAAGRHAAAALPIREPGEASGWFNVSVHPLAGRRGYSFWRLQDITARHEMEEVIRGEQDKLADFLDNAPIGFYSVDGSGRFLFINETLAQWLGGSPDEIVNSGATLQDFISGEVAPGAPSHAPFDAGSGGGPQGGELVLKGRQGRIIYASISQSVVQAGDELRTRSVVRDLTPEREWEEALRLSRQRFQRFFANAPVGIALINREGRLDEANRALGVLFDSSPQQLIGEKLVDFLSDEDRREIATKLTEVADGKTVSGPVEVRLKGAREKTASLFVSRLDAADSGDGGVILHFIDATEQKNLEVQFAQSQKMQAVGQLAGGVAHDFNNLLTAMIGFCDLLLLRFRPGDPSFADIMQIKQNANRAANLVRQLLAFSRQQTLQPQGPQHHRRARRAVASAAPADRREHRAEDGARPRSRPRQGRPGPARAGHHQPRGQRARRHARRRLADHPHQQHRQRLFDAARPRGHAARRVRADRGHRYRHGHPQGEPHPHLRAVLLDQGGRLRHRARPLDGLRHRQADRRLRLRRSDARQRRRLLDLPAAPPAATRPSPRRRAEPGESAAARDLTGAGTVLLVEDEDPVRLFSARALRNKGYKVIEAKSGEAALEVIHRATETIDLLVTDVVMPRMDGPSLIREVRETHPDMKVIFISGYTEDSFRKRLDTDAEIHFLPKPFSLKQLAGKVKEVMSAGEG